MPPERVRVHPHGRLGLLRPQRRGRCRRRRGADRSRVARPAGARAVDARGRARVGAVRPGDGVERARARCDGGRHRRLGVRASGATRTPPARARRAQLARRPASAKRRSRRRRRSRSRCPQAAATATRFRSTRSRTRASSHHFLPDDAAARLGAARARRVSRTCSRSRASWTSWRSRRTPIRSSSACGTSRTRARATWSRAAAERFGWRRRARQRGRGRGFGFARYKNLAAYCAVAVEVEVDPRDRPRAAGARGRGGRQRRSRQSGRHPQPDRRRHHPVDELDAVRSGDASTTTRITSRDWATYPILRFSNVPEAVDVHIINRPGLPFLGTGEAAQGPDGGGDRQRGVATRSACGIRDLPLTHERIRAAVNA